MKNLKKIGIVALLAFVVVAGPLKKTVAPVSAVAETVENNPVLTKENFKQVKDFFKPISNYLGKKIEDGLSWIILKSAAEEHTLTEAEFVKVVDGDTIVVSVDGEQKKVRLLSINTEIYSVPQFAPLQLICNINLYIGSLFFFRPCRGEKRLQEGNTFFCLTLHSGEQIVLLYVLFGNLFLFCQQTEYFGIIIFIDHGEQLLTLRRNIAGVFINDRWIRKI